MKNGIFWAVLVVFGINLVYDINYYLSRSASGHLTSGDGKLCIVDGVISLALIVFAIVKLILNFIKRRNENR